MSARLSIVLENLQRHSGRCRNALADALREQDNGTKVKVLVAQADSLADTARAAGLDVRVWGGRDAFRRRNPAWMRWLVRRLRDDPPDIIHTHGYGDTWAVAQSWSGPLVVSVHARFRVSGGDWTGDLIKILACADQVLAYGEGTRRELVQAGLNANRISLMYPALPAEIGRGRVERRNACIPKRLLATAARLDTHKRVGLLLEALARLRRGGEDVGLLVAGDGPDSESLRAQAEGLGIGDAVQWLGWVGTDLSPRGWSGEILATIAAADTFVMCSVMEGLCGAVVEAMALGVPVCVSDGVAEGFPDDLELVIHRTDDVDDLVDTLLQGGRPGDAAVEKARQWALASCSATAVDSILTRTYRNARQEL